MPSQLLCDCKQHIVITFSADTSRNGLASFIQIAMRKKKSHSTVAGRSEKKITSFQPAWLIRCSTLH